MARDISSDLSKVRSDLEVLRAQVEQARNAIAQTDRLVRRVARETTAGQDARRF